MARTAARAAGALRSGPRGAQAQLKSVPGGVTVRVREIQRRARRRKAARSGRPPMAFFEIIKFCTIRPDDVEDLSAAVTDSRQSHRGLAGCSLTCPRRIAADSSL